MRKFFYLIFLLLFPFSSISQEGEEPAIHSIWSIAWHPSGDTIAISKAPDQCNSFGNYAIDIVDAVSLETVQQVALSNYCPSHILEWNPDGQRLLDAGYSTALDVLDT